MPKKSRPPVARTPTRRQLTRWERERRFRQILIGVVAFVVALVFTIPAYGYYKEVYARGREAIAVVNNKSFTMDEYVRLLSFRQYQLELGLNYLRSLGTDQSGGAQLAQQLQMQRATLPTQVVFEWVDDEIIASAAPRLGVSVTSADIWDEMKRQNLGEPKEGETVNEAQRDSDLQQAIKNIVDGSGITADEYKRTVELGLLRRKIESQLKEQIVTPTVQVRVQGIIVNEKDAAQAAYDRIRAGEDFAKVAAEVSIDSGSKENGGELGWVPQGLLSLEFDKTVFAMSPGQLSEPFSTNEGYYIVKVLERDAARDLDADTLEAVKAGALSRWLAEEKEKVTVDYRITSEKQFWAQEKIGKDNAKRAKKFQQSSR